MVRKPAGRDEVIGGEGEIERGAGGGVAGAGDECLVDVLLKRLVFLNDKKKKGGGGVGEMNCEQGWRGKRTTYAGR